MIDEHISVWIESPSGEIYNEYEHKEAKPGRNECWIESKQSQNFRICWRFRGTTSHSIKAVIWLDGIEVGGGLLRSYEVHHTFRMSGRAIGDSKRRPFVFGKQQLTDDESSSSHLPNPEDLNTIWVIFDYVTFVDYTTTPPSPPKNRGALHETVVKAGHGDSAGLGDPIPSPLKRWCKTEKVPGTKQIRFVFHYAPFEWLLARGIVSGPRPRVVENRTSPAKRKSPEKSRPTRGPPTTPQQLNHTLQELLIYDSDSDSDVIILDDYPKATPKATANQASPPPNKRSRSAPSKSNGLTLTPVTPPNPSKSRPRPTLKPKPNKEDVIDLASSDDDFEIQ